ncbi:MAG: hypothetical protein NUV49_00690 [Patescibacteria group bacterium]|nr:hypothetical protein [Patescibacteria group bacterium]
MISSFWTCRGWVVIDQTENAFATTLPGRTRSLVFTSVACRGSDIKRWYAMDIETGRMFVWKIHGTYPRIPGVLNKAMWATALPVLTSAREKALLPQQPFSFMLDKV